MTARTRSFRCDRWIMLNGEIATIKNYTMMMFLFVIYRMIDVSCENISYV